MFEYVLVIYINNTPMYEGNFESCAHATTYVNKCLIKTVVPKDFRTACLYQDYINLPANFHPVYPDMECSKD